MYISSVQLTMSHTGLGDLNEYALMVLFGNAHSLHLTQGLSITPGEIVSMDGTKLYPAYFWTHLKVPVAHLLSDFKLWEVVDVGVDVKRFGDTLLESRYALGRKDKLGVGPDEWDENRFPVMHGNNLIVAEELNSSTAKRMVLNPNPDRIAELPKVSRSPQGIAKSRQIRSKGIKMQLERVAFECDKPFGYTIMDGRDCTHGHAMIFAKFADIFDLAEKDFLSRQIFPGLSAALLSRLHILEREIYYYGNCYAGEEIEVYLAGSVDINQNDEIQDGFDYIPAAFLRIGFEIYQQRTRTLLASCLAKKVFAIPMQEQENIHDLHRTINRLQPQTIL